MINVLDVARRCITPTRRRWSTFRLSWKWRHRKLHKEVRYQYHESIQMSLNRECDSNEWPSKRIAIIIRMYSEAQYNARILYHQQCLKCNNLSKPHLDDSYAERVTYRLKKWCEMKMNRPFYSGQSEDSHQSNLCERCKNDHCSQLWSRRLD